MEITTNGTKLLENLQTVKKYIDVLKISIDAYDEEMAVQIARNPMAQNTRNVIEECCREGIRKIGFNFVYMKQNEKELPKLIGFARRLRVGCDSYNYICDGIVVNMKDSISCTHRAKICERCTEYCQEGIYSLKHSVSGWVSVCPSNTLSLGNLLDGSADEKRAHDIFDKYVATLNEISRVDHTGATFMEKGFREFDTPILIPETGERYNAVFSIDLDGKPAMLADSHI